MVLLLSAGMALAFTIWRLEGRYADLRTCVIAPLFSYCEH
jgi:hypothetical protein